MSKEHGMQPVVRSTSTGADVARRPAWVELLAALSRPPRRATRRLRHRVEASLHPWRRGRAARALLDRLPVRSIVVLCYGNICRSPYAEFRLREGLGEVRKGSIHGITVTSAGFFGPGRPSTEVAVEAARQRGINLVPHRSRIVTQPFLAAHDLVLVMTREQVRATRKVHPEAFVLHLGDLDPATPTQRDIPDPYGHTKEVFLDVYARVDRAVEALVALLRTGSEEGGRP